MNSLLSTLFAAFVAVPFQATPQEVPEEVKKIRAAYTNYDEEGALALCNEYLVTHPNDPLVMELRARCLFQLQRFEDALATMRGITVPGTRARLFLAECLAHSKDGGAEAQQIVDEVAAEDPSGTEPHMTRCRIYLTLNKMNEAAAELSYVRTTAPKLFEGQLIAGRLSEMAGQLDEALNLYRPLVAKAKEFTRTDPHHERDAVFWLAGVYMKMQQYDRSIEIYQQVAQRFPKWSGAYSQLAVCQSLMEKPGAALSSMEKAVELSNGSPDMRLRYAELLKVANRPEDAIHQYEEMIKSTQPGELQALADVKLAELYLDQGDLEKARPHGEAGIQILPKHPDAQLIHGRLREKLGDDAAARDAYRAVLAVDPLQYDALFRLAGVLGRSKEPAEKEEGRQLVLRHQKIEPYAREIQRATRELDVNPRNPAVLTRLAGFLNLAGEYPQARRFGEASARIQPKNPATFIQLGYISANLGDNDAALKCFTTAQGLVPKGALPKLDEYIETLKKKEPLTLPMGEAFKPAQKAAEEEGKGSGKPAGN